MAAGYFLAVADGAGFRLAAFPVLFAPVVFPDAFLELWAFVDFTLRAVAGFFALLIFALPAVFSPLSDVTISNNLSRVDLRRIIVEMDSRALSAS